MTTAESARLARRGFLSRLTAAVGTAALFTTPGRLPAALAAAPLGAVGPDPDAWIERVRGRDRLILHAHQKLDRALVAAHGIRADAQRAYGVPESENGIAIAAHGPAIGGLFTDATWQRFALGERYAPKGPDGKPATTNPFLRPQEGVPAEATVPALLERGVVIVVCNVAVGNLARRVTPTGERAETVHEALVAGLVPGIVVVPNAFVAIAHGQQRGLGYLYID
jgi:intracellular sulfur oxidation DsrE/DsrF family protein